MFETTVNNLRKIDEGLIFKRVFDIQHVKDYIINLNTTDQLFEKGIDREGRELDEIGGGYSPFSIEKKKAKGLPTDRITLFDDGPFFESWRVDSATIEITISANIARIGEENYNRFGRKIVGLTNENIQKIINYVTPIFQEEYKKEVLRAIVF